MSIMEILKEIKELRTKIMMEPEGSIRIGELTVALTCLYEEYVRLTESERKAA